MKKQGGENKRRGGRGDFVSCELEKIMEKEKTLQKKLNA
jgi:hypothetical protein